MKAPPITLLDPIAILGLGLTRNRTIAKGTYNITEQQQPLQVPLPQETKSPAEYKSPAQNSSLSQKASHLLFLRVWSCRTPAGTPVPPKPVITPRGSRWPPGSSAASGQETASSLMWCWSFERPPIAPGPRCSRAPACCFHGLTGTNAGMAS